MATYLSGVQKLAIECGLTSLPTTTASQTGEFRRFVEWYKDSWTRIQQRLNWRWQRHGFSLPTVASTQAYAYTAATDTTDAETISRFREWRIEDIHDPPKIYLTSGGASGQRWMTYTPYEWFASVYMIGSQSEGYPAHITIDPRDRLLLGPTPDAVYTLTGDYIRSAQILADDSDIPEMPTEYHDLIWQFAMFNYGMFEAAPEAVQRAEILFNEGIRKLEATQTPRIQLGPTLVA